MSYDKRVEKTAARIFAARPDMTAKRAVNLAEALIAELDARRRKRGNEAYAWWLKVQKAEAEAGGAGDQADRGAPETREGADP